MSRDRELLLLLLLLRGWLSRCCWMLLLRRRDSAHGHHGSDAGTTKNRSIVAGADVGNEDDVLEVEEGRVDVGLVLEDVEARVGDDAVAQRLGQGRFVDDGAAGGVDEGRGRLHQGELAGADQMVGLRRQRRVQAEDVGGGEQLVQVEPA